MTFPAYPDYRDSGVEWVGAIPDHWSASPLKRAFKIEGGSTPTPDEDNWDGDIAWVTPADLSGLSSLFLDVSKRTITATGLASCGTTLLPAGSLILSTRAPIGSLAIALISMCTNQGCKGLVPNANASAAYFAFVLLTAKDELNNRGRGSTFLEISGDELSRFSVPTPPFAEQTQIARFLDHETARIDALIEEQQRLIELLKEKRQAVISHAVTKGLDPTVPMKDSGVEWLGEVPAHWHVKKLKNVTRQIIDGAHFTPTYVDEGVPFIRVTDIQTQDLDLDSIKRIPKGEHCELIKRCNPEKGDVLLSKNGTIGITKIIDWDFEFSIFVSLCLLKPAQNITSKYLLNVLSGNYAVEQFKDSGQKTSVTNLHLEKIREIFIVLPSKAEQLSISTFIEHKTAELDLLISEAMQGNSFLPEFIE